MTEERLKKKHKLLEPAEVDNKRIKEDPDYEGVLSPHDADPCLVQIKDEPGELQIKQESLQEFSVTVSLGTDLNESVEEENREDRDGADGENCSDTDDSEDWTPSAQSPCPQTQTEKVQGNNMEEKLIFAVSTRPELYDRKAYYYRDRNRKKLAWREISTQIAEPVHVCQSKWKGLRDTYTKYMKKKKGGEADHKPPWRFTHILSFLDPFIMARRSRNNANQVEDTAEELSTTPSGPDKDEAPEIEGMNEKPQTELCSVQSVTSDSVTTAVAVAESAEPNPEEPRATPSPMVTSGSQSPVPGPSSSTADPPTPAPPQPSDQARKTPVMRRARIAPSAVEQALLEALKQPRLRPTREFTAVEHFLLSLAPALERLSFLQLELVKAKINELILEHLKKSDPDLM